MSADDFSFHSADDFTFHGCLRYRVSRQVQRYPVEQEVSEILGNLKVPEGGSISADYDPLTCGLMLTVSGDFLCMPMAEAIDAFTERIGQAEIPMSPYPGGGFIWRSDRYDRVVTFSFDENGRAAADSLSDLVRAKHPDAYPD